ncbi:hypothetical protein FJZ33_10150, partial [Candidatus Poribacteria bacterium]|nr:hypothetical protein [Candidatus Poribacteria bacterium]
MPKLIYYILGLIAIILVASCATQTNILPKQELPSAKSQQRGMKPEIGGSNLVDTTYRNSWALLIGINKYPQLPAQYQLNYAVNDVEALREILVKQYNFPAANVFTLWDEQATLPRIKAVMSRLTDPQQVKFEDRVLVYFSGHGQTVLLPTGGEIGYLLPYDAAIDIDDVENPSLYYSTCLGMDELKRLSTLITAKHVLFLMDSCYSGLAVSSRGGLEPSVPDYLSKVASLRSRQIITAGLKGDKSYEDPNWGHGAFTYKLLEGLQTGVADGNSDGIITGMELATYLRNVVPAISPNQTPQYGY